MFPLLFIVTAALFPAIRFSCAIAVCPACVPIILLLLLLSIEELDNSN